MLKLALRSALTIAALPCLLACEAETPDAPAAPLVVKTSMNEVITPQTQVFLDVMIEALDDQGDVDPALLSDEDWAALEAAAVRLRDEALAMRDDEIRVVAAPDETIDGEDSPGGLAAAEVQARIDENPDDFRAYADELRAHLAPMVAAAQMRDAATLWDLALNLDQQCAGCHEQYWYP